MNGWLGETDVDCDEALRRAQNLSERHTEKLGCRAFDVLHVASALVLECEVFLTADAVQGKLARAEGLDVKVFGQGR